MAVARQHETFAPIVSCPISSQSHKVKRHMPRVSVIIPTYNTAEYIPQAIESVLNQTYSDWELIVVNDGSTDSTASVMNQFDDPRVRYIYQTHKGRSSARNTGIAHSLGEYLAFLDADDMYHPSKLEVQVAHLDHHSEIGLSYHSGVEIDEHGNPLRLRRSPVEVSLKDLLLGFPFSMNDFIVRRSWPEQVGGFDETLDVNEDRDFRLRLVLAGCRFAGIERFLAYRRLHAGRVFQNLAATLEDMVRVLDTVFADTRCPVEVLAVREVAYASIFLSCSYLEFIQDETALAREHLREAVRLDPSILHDGASRLLTYFVDASTRDGGEHEAPLRSVFAQLPPEMASLAKHCDWAVARGYLKRGTRDVMWGRLEQGRVHFARAAELEARVDERFLRELTPQVLNCEAAFGVTAAQIVLRDLSLCLEKVGSHAQVRRLRACYTINRAFRDYRAGQYAKVPLGVFRAVSNDPTYLTNRGVIAILARSFVGVIRQSQMRCRESIE